jgi:hypothetical protein
MEQTPNLPSALETDSPGKPPAEYIYQLATVAAALLLLLTATVV